MIDCADARSLAKPNQPHTPPDTIPHTPIPSITAGLTLDANSRVALMAKLGAGAGLQVCVHTYKETDSRDARGCVTGSYRSSGGWGHTRTCSCFSSLPLLDIHPQTGHTTGACPPHHAGRRCGQPAHGRDERPLPGAFVRAYLPLYSGCAPSNKPLLTYRCPPRTNHHRAPAPSRCRCKGRPPAAS